jgi:hypothetical protein
MNPSHSGTPPTRVSINGDKWYLNGSATYPGAPAEGLLMNVRMANAVFEDANRPHIDPEAITERFIARIPDYVAHGVRAFTLCLQGGYPGYEGALNSAFNPDGSLREPHLNRVRRVIEACDQQGAVVILGCYYQRQSHILEGEEALRQGVGNTARWIAANGFTNVALEIANEYGHEGYLHPMLKSSAGQVELIKRAKRIAPGLLVSTSRQGHKGLVDTVCRASDFVLVHFNQVSMQDISALVTPLKGLGKPIVCNEDRKIGQDGARAAEICVAVGCSWGLMTREVNQYHPPFRFDGHLDDPAVYAKLKELTTSHAN